MTMPDSHRALIAVGLVSVLTIGCGDPIYDSVINRPPSGGLVLSDSADVDDYQWPLHGSKFIVEKPPPMQYLTSFTEKFSFDDEFDAPLVGWDDLDLSQHAQNVLRAAYDELPTELMPIVTIPIDDFANENAFDISRDGNRLVILQETKLVLFNLETGERIGEMAIPGNWNEGPASAVRFCGKTKDFLVSSKQQIVRISGQNGKITEQRKGTGETLKRWDVNPADTSMLLLTASGKLFTGDSHLKKLSKSDIGNRTIQDASISHDGARLIAADDRNLLFYYQKNNDIVHKNHVPIQRPTGSIRVACGIMSDTWINERKYVHLSFAEDDAGRLEPSFRSWDMFWRPHLAVACNESDDSNWFLMVGERVFEARRQWVLYDFGPNSRSHSVPIVLPEKPKRLLASAEGDIVGLLSDKHLGLYRRPFFASAFRISFDDAVNELVLNQRPTEIEKTYFAIGRQKQWTKGESPSELQTDLLHLVAEKWNRLESMKDQLEPLETAALTRLKRWHDEGGILATTISAVRHNKIAWKARGTGVANTVSPQDWKVFVKEGEIASRELERIIESNEVPAAAFQLLISLQIQKDGDFNKVNALVRRAVQEYPRNLRIALSVGFMFLPQWHGTAGDVGSFCNAHSKIFDGKYRSISYARMIGTLSYQMQNANALDWESLNIRRVMEGIEHRRKMNWPVSYDIWYLKAAVANAGGRHEVGEMYRYFMAETATHPDSQYTIRPFVWDTADLKGEPLKRFNAAKREP